MHIRGFIPDLIQVDIIIYRHSEKDVQVSLRPRSQEVGKYIFCRDPRIAAIPLFCHIMYKLEHIGIAVKSLADSEPLFEKLLNTPSYKREAVTDQQVITS